MLFKSITFILICSIVTTAQFIIDEGTIRIVLSKEVNADYSEYFLKSENSTERNVQYSSPQITSQNIEEFIPINLSFNASEEIKVTEARKTSYNSTTNVIESYGKYVKPFILGRGDIESISLEPIKDIDMVGDINLNGICTEKVELILSTTSYFVDFYGGYHAITSYKKYTDAVSGTINFSFPSIPTGLSGFGIINARVKCGNNGYILADENELLSVRRDFSISTSLNVGSLNFNLAQASLGTADVSGTFGTLSGPETQTPQEQIFTLLNEKSTAAVFLNNKENISVDMVSNTYTTSIPVEMSGSTFIGYANYSWIDKNLNYGFSSDRKNKTSMYQFTVMDGGNEIVDLAPTYNGPSDYGMGRVNFENLDNTIDILSVKVGYIREATEFDGGEYGYTIIKNGDIGYFPIFHPGTYKWGIHTETTAKMTVEEKMYGNLNRHSIKTTGEITLSGGANNSSNDHTIDITTGGIPYLMEYSIPTGQASFWVESDNIAYSDLEVYVENAESKGLFTRQLVNVHAGVVTAVVTPGVYTGFVSALFNGKKVKVGEINFKVVAGDKILVSIKGSPVIDLAEPITSAGDGTCVSRNSFNVSGTVDGVSGEIIEIVGFEIYDGGTYGPEYQIPYTAAGTTQQPYLYTFSDVYSVIDVADEKVNFALKVKTDNKTSVIARTVMSDASIPLLAITDPLTPYTAATDQTSIRIKGHVTNSTSPITRGYATNGITTKGFNVGSGNNFEFPFPISSGLNSIEIKVENKCNESNVVQLEVTVPTAPQAIFNCQLAQETSIIGENMILDGAMSRDEDGLPNPLTYTWYKNNTPISGMTDASAFFPITVSTPSPIAMKLCVSDGLNTDCSADCSITPFEHDVTDYVDITGVIDDLTGPMISGNTIYTVASGEVKFLKVGSPEQESVNAIITAIPNYLATIQLPVSPTISQVIAYQELQWQDRNGNSGVLKDSWWEDLAKAPQIDPATNYIHDFTPTFNGEYDYLKGDIQFLNIINYSVDRIDVMYERREQSGMGGKEEGTVILVGGNHEVLIPIRHPGVYTWGRPHNTTAVLDVVEAQSPNTSGSISFSKVINASGNTDPHVHVQTASNSIALTGQVYEIPTARLKVTLNASVALTDIAVDVERLDSDETDFTGSFTRIVNGSSNEISLILIPGQYRVVVKANGRKFFGEVQTTIMSGENKEIEVDEDPDFTSPVQQTPYIGASASTCSPVTINGSVYTDGTAITTLTMTEVNNGNIVSLVPVDEGADRWSFSLQNYVVQSPLNNRSELLLTAQLTSGLTLTKSLFAFSDNILPILNIVSPVGSNIIEHSATEVTLQGTVTSTGTQIQRLTVNNSEVSFSSGGLFSETYPLNLGPNTFDIEVETICNNSTHSISVIKKSIPRAVVDCDKIKFYDIVGYAMPADGSGSHDLDGDALNYSWTIDGQSSFPNQSDVTYTVPNRNFDVALTVTDVDGNSNTAVCNATPKDQKFSGDCMTTKTICGINYEDGPPYSNIYIQNKDNVLYFLLETCGDIPFESDQYVEINSDNSSSGEPVTGADIRVKIDHYRRAQPPATTESILLTLEEYQSGIGWVFVEEKNVANEVSDIWGLTSFQPTTGKHGIIQFPVQIQPINEIKWRLNGSQYDIPVTTNSMNTYNLTQ
ncbi:MAG: PKD domain-containing protein [Fibrobacterales bacterium]